MLYNPRLAKDEVFFRPELFISYFLLLLIPLSGYYKMDCDSVHRKTTFAKQFCSFIEVNDICSNAT